MDEIDAELHDKWGLHFDGPFIASSLNKTADEENEKKPKVMEYMKVGEGESVTFGSDQEKPLIIETLEVAEGGSVTFGSRVGGGASSVGDNL